ncbi:tyrosine-type recombinase/integrase [Vibrio diabolicus]|uniref:tyrosine-type recombinase/integrase n=1 Tax=Vibrio diabolicus TaxID=50719 RepID=UPI00375314A7
MYQKHHHSTTGARKNSSKDAWAEINNPKEWGKRTRIKGNANHPKKGDKIKFEPIRSKEGIAAIKSLLSESPRDFALFTLGINTAYRANELLRLRIADVRHLRAGDTLDIWQTKTGKYRRVVLNNSVVDALQKWIEHSGLDGDAPLFVSRKGGALMVPTLNNMVKDWCNRAGLVGNYGSHTLRKTWGYWQRKENQTPLPLLMTAFGHSTEQQTLDYLCIQSDEISELYSYEL